MPKKGDNKAVSLALQAREWLEKLKARSRSETKNIKAELRAVKEVTEIGYQQMYKVVNLQRELDDMQEDMIKTEWIELWKKCMEGAITPVLFIIYDPKRNLEIGGWIVEGV